MNFSNSKYSNICFDLGILRGKYETILRTFGE